MRKTVNVVKVPVTNLEEVKKMQDNGIPVSSVEVTDGVSVLVYRQEVNGGVVVKATKTDPSPIFPLAEISKGVEINLQVSSKDGVEINDKVKYVAAFDVDAGTFSLVPEGYKVVPIVEETKKSHALKVGDVVYASLKEAAKAYPDSAAMATRDGKVNRNLFVGLLLGRGLTVE